jgi:hypothetical protein
MKKTMTIMLAALLLSSIISRADGFPEIEGWHPESKVNIYRRGDLWEYINGAAEQFVMYGFQLLRFREFSKEDRRMSVEIYDMGSALNAFGIYTTERPEEGKRLSIGTEAVVGPSLCLFFKDRYYIKVMMLRGLLDDQSGEAVLKAIEPYILGETGLPPELNILPMRERISGSGKYVTEAYKGLSELSNILFADYENATGNAYRYFLVIPTSEETVERVWKKLSEKWVSTRFEGHTILCRDIPYEGKIGIIRKGNKILGVSGISDETELYTRLVEVL